MGFITITVPEPHPAGRWAGPADIVFVDGVVTIDEDIYPTMRMYAARHGYSVVDVDAPTPTPTPDADQSTPAPPSPMDQWTVADLRAYADARGVPTAGVTKKADLIALIEQHAAAVPDPAPSGSRD